MRKANQSGNAVILVLLGIILFAALAYTLMNSAKTGQGNLTKHQAGLYATEIMNYTASVERAYNRIRQMPCSEQEISFEHDGILGNASAPSDQSCHVFTGPNSIPYTLPPAGAQAKPIANPHGFNWFITNDNKFSGNGSSANNTGKETALILPALQESVCREINERVGIGSIIPIESDDTINIVNRVGFIINGTSHACNDNGIPCNRTEFCVDQRGAIWPGTVPTGFVYVKVIHVR